MKQTPVQFCPHIPASPSDVDVIANTVLVSPYAQGVYLTSFTNTSWEDHETCRSVTYVFRLFNATFYNGSSLVFQTNASRSSLVNIGSRWLLPTIINWTGPIDRNARYFWTVSTSTVVGSSIDTVRLSRFTASSDALLCTFLCVRSFDVAHSRRRLHFHSFILARIRCNLQQIRT